MSDVNIYPADASIAETSGLNLKKRAAMYQQSVADPEEFWKLKCINQAHGLVKCVRYHDDLMAFSDIRPRNNGE